MSQSPLYNKAANEDPSQKCYFQSYGGNLNNLQYISKTLHSHFFLAI